MLKCLQVLKPACEAALRRIFKLCDVDKNGILDAAELNEFQRKCFDSPLQTQELEGIQDMVRQHGDDGVAVVEVEPLDKTRSSPSSIASSFSSLSSRSSTSESSTHQPNQRVTQAGGSTSPSRSQITGLTELGFLYLHTIFIQRGRLETTWTVLRKFGYAEDLRLTEDFLAPRFDVPHGCSVELSQKGYEFLTSLFVGFDKVSKLLPITCGVC
jgi:Ras family protein T1